MIGAEAAATPARNRAAPSLALLLLAIAANAGASLLVGRLYPDRPIVPDLLFDLLPDIPFLAYLTDPLIALAVAASLAALPRGEKQALWRLVAILAACYFARAALSALTPLGRPTGNEASYGIFSFIGLKQHGMFPSGHAMLSAALYFQADARRSPAAKRLLGILAAAESVALLLSRGHYSIDIAGGLMIAWIAVELERKRSLRSTRVSTRGPSAG